MSEINNALKMREALKQIQAYASSHELFEVEAIAGTALAEQPRNCDVGTAGPQTKRFFIFCGKYSECVKCPCYMKDRSAPTVSCFAQWAQMQYEKGGAE